VTPFEAFLLVWLTARLGVAILDYRRRHRVHNFDTARQARAEAARAAPRTFQIGGETFVRRDSVRPEVLTAWEAVTPETPASETLEIVDTLVGEFLIGDGHSRWLALRQRYDDPITLSDMMEVVVWLVQEETTFPTTEPSPSSDGSGGPTTGGSSTDAAPSAGLTPVPSLSDVSSEPPTPS
jgi:hypothetical protein